MRRLTVSLAFLLIAALITDVSAEKPRKRPAGGSEAGNDSGGPGGPGFGGRPGRDPAQLVTRMLGQFDKDGDQKLDATELKEMFSNMQQRRGRGMRQGRPGQRRGAEARRRRGGSETPATPGGDQPQRPPIEE